MRSKLGICGAWESSNYVYDMVCPYAPGKYGLGAPPGAILRARRSLRSACSVVGEAREKSAAKSGYAATVVQNKKGSQRLPQDEILPMKRILPAVVSVSQKNGEFLTSGVPFTLRAS